MRYPAWPSQAFHEIAHLLRPAHLQQLSNILKDPEASENDRYVALEFLKNASISLPAAMLPMCQDTGTAIVFGKKGQRVWVQGNEEEAFSYGVHRTYTETNLRYSQMAPLTMFNEVNTGNNLPVQFDILAAPGEHHADEFHLMFIAKGGGSANKTYLYQETRAVLTPEKIISFIETKIKTLGTSACPPYHLSIVIGGTSAEATLKTVKLGSTKWLDELPDHGLEKPGMRFGISRWKRRCWKSSRRIGIGAQFGGKYFCHDVRVIRLPRHGASLPIGIGVSCSADRQIKAKITPEGIFLEQLETDPAKYLPEVLPEHLGGDVGRHRPQPADAGNSGDTQPLSDQNPRGADRHHRGCARYCACETERAAGSRRRPARLYQEPSGLLRWPGEDTHRHGDGKLSVPPPPGAWIAMWRSFRPPAARWSCWPKATARKQCAMPATAYGGFYLGSIGGPAAVLAQNNITKVEVLEYPELGMEAVWKIEVKDFPAFIIVDDKGNDFFADLA